HGGETPRRRISDCGGSAARERDLAQGKSEILREGKIARGQRGRSRRVESRRLFGQELRVGKEEGLAVDPIPAQLALLDLARLEVFDGHTQLQELRLVALQLSLSRGARAAVLLGKELAQLGERDRLARIEEERDQVEQALRAIHF